jgi:hypothetical protein
MSDKLELIDKKRLNQYFHEIRASLIDDRKYALLLDDKDYEASINEKIKILDVIIRDVIRGMFDIKEPIGKGDDTE